MTEETVKQLWSNERIVEEINDAWNRDGELYGPNVKPIMQKMRDEYEREIAKMQSLIDALNENGNAQQEAMLSFQQKHITELEAQLTATLATIERAAAEVEQ